MQYWTTEESEFKFHEGQVFSILHIAHTGSVAHTTFYPMGIWRSFPGGIRWQGHEADYSSTSAEVKKTWIFTSTRPYVFMA
jgi:hypothetical protein